MKTAIRRGDADSVRQLLHEDSARANELISWGNCLSHPLHYVSDMLFEGVLQSGKELPLVETLVQAGANLDFQKDGKGDTPLIGAASLGAEDVGLMLLDAGARPDLRGLFGETALHWAALFGEDRLAARLIECSDLNLKDEKYGSPPLGWAIHGWSNPPDGNRANHRRQREVVELLIAAAVLVEPEWLESENVRAHPAIFAALQSRLRRAGNESN